MSFNWSMGTLGYFPTYTMDNLNAAQLMHRVMLDNPSLESELARGEYQNLLAWLRQKVHSQGQRQPPQDLMKSATGEPTKSSYHVEYLRKKFLNR